MLPESSRTKSRLGSTDDVEDVTNGEVARSVAPCTLAAATSRMAARLNVLNNLFFMTVSVLPGGYKATTA